MNCSGLVLQEEKRSLRSVEAFFNEIWGDTNLPSHDLNHHRRVWNYAKEVLIYFEKVKMNPVFIRNLLIACYFHDAGMSVERGVRHGCHSRRIVEKYLSINNLNESDYSDALDAIKNHDKKEYYDGSEGNAVLKILSVADDLDAFGSIGIMRYMEIYRERGVPENRIAGSILGNAAARFANFELFATDKPELYNVHRKRYAELKQFFENYNQSSSPKR